MRNARGGIRKSLDAKRCPHSCKNAAATVIRQIPERSVRIINPSAINTAGEIETDLFFSLKIKNASSLFLT